MKAAARDLPRIAPERGRPVELGQAARHLNDLVAGYWEMAFAGALQNTLDLLQVGAVRSFAEVLFRPQRGKLLRHRNVNKLRFASSNKEDCKRSATLLLLMTTLNLLPD